MLVKQLKTKEQQGRFLSMLLGTLGASLLGDLLTDKEALGTVQDEVQLELVKVHLDQVRVVNNTACFNKFCNTKILLKWTLFIHEIINLK